MKPISIYIAAIFCLLLSHQTIKAQTPKTHTAAEILQDIKKLKVLGSVLYIAAHPDDENTRLLAWLSNEKLYRTGYLSLTRGDGGQNLIGDEQGIDLGLIRTQELLAARRVDGAEQFFSRAFDFGFSKNPEEALSIWNHDKILSDVVRVIRKFKPDVIICRFPTTGEGGHGHHTASAILAQEAFDAAADASKFPEQLQSGLTIWQARRLMWNTFNFGGTNTQKEDQLKIDVGGYNPLLGESYGEIAARSRSQHKSQGFGVPSQRGSAIEYFKTLKGSEPEKEILEQINTSWSRIGLPVIDTLIDKLINSFQPEHPENSLPSIVKLYDSLQRCNKTDYWIVQKEKEIKQLIASCSGLYLEANSSTANLVPSDSIHITYAINDRLSYHWDSATVKAFEQTSVLSDIKPNITATITRNQILPDNFAISNPYWLNQKKETGSFNIDNPLLIGDAESKPLTAIFTLYKNGQAFQFEQPIVYKNTDPVKGETYQPVYVIPPINIIPDQTLMLNNNHSQKNISFTIVANRDITINKIYQVAGTQKQLIKYKLLNVKKGEKRHFTVSAFDGMNQILVYEKEKVYQQEIKSIQYDHIPTIQYNKAAAVNCVNMKVKISKGKIGYIEGAGDKVMESLQQLGYDITPLNKQDINTANLSQFSTIITGVRAYNTNEWLNDVYDTLMNFIKKGGTLLVQYNTSNSIGPLKAKIGPYPFTISRKRITDENAVVRFTDSSNRFLHFPNAINTSDFNGWVQERSIYHAADWDAHYKTIFSMHDPGEADEEGSLIYTQYGKGNFIYTGIVFYRELPAGVEGTYKLIANLIN